MVKLAHSFSALKTFDLCPKKYYHLRVAKDVKDQGGEASRWGERVHAELEARLKDGTALTSADGKWEHLCRAFEGLPGELLVEQELTLNADLKPTGWWDSDAWLRSKLDVLVLHHADAVVADWKTGKYRPDFDQLELFAIQVFKHYPQVQRVKTVFVWLKDMKVDTRSYTRLDAPTIWNKFLQKINRIEQAVEHDNWPASPSGLCPWCPAREICEYA